MTLEDPKTGRQVFVYWDPWNGVAYGTKLRCGNAWYVHKDQEIRWWPDFERLEVVK